MLPPASEPRAAHIVVVESSVLASIEYASDQTLDLTFRSGRRYRYFAVPHAVVDELLAAESKGAYFNHRIRDRFPYQRLP